jgi:DNA primase
MRKAERAILVEGYFDVVRPALAGIEEVVAPLGTGLTGDQAALLKRYTNHVILLYDSDEAGLRATFRAGDELLRYGLRVSVATLPPGEDPDTIVQQRGAAALEAVLKDSVDVFERKIQILERKGFFSTLPGRRRALDRLLPTIRAAQDPITRELYLTRGAEAAGIRKDVLERETGSEKREAGRPQPPSPASRFSLPDMPANAEKALLLLLLGGDPWRARVLETVHDDDFEFPAYRAVFQAAAENAPERLDETAARAYEELKAEGTHEGEADELFERAVNWVEARRIERQVDELKRALPLASVAEQDRMVLEMQRLVLEGNRRFPQYGITKRRSGAPGS